MRSVFGVLRYLASIRAALSVSKAEYIVIFITNSLALTEGAVPLAFLYPSMSPNCGWEFVIAAPESA